LPVGGISHITFVVKHLERSAGLFELVLGAEEVYSSGEGRFSLSKERFCLVGGVWMALMEATSWIEQSYSHAAFKIPASELEQFRSRLEAAGAELGEGRDGCRAIAVLPWILKTTSSSCTRGTHEERLDAYRRYSGT
jgi:catechol 2,3-dioxygenase-like lactoylglutathione lyase family enzyme